MTVLVCTLVESVGGPFSARVSQVCVPVSIVAERSCGTSLLEPTFYGPWCYWVPPGAWLERPTDASPLSCRKNSCWHLDSMETELSMWEAAGYVVLALAWTCMFVHSFLHRVATLECADPHVLGNTPALKRHLFLGDLNVISL